MSQIAASVFIITLNAGETLEAALKSVSDFTQIVVVDCGSQDETLAIARCYAHKVVHHDFTGYGAQKAFALGLCEQDWVLNIDADEQASPELLDNIRTIMVANKPDGLMVPVVDKVFGRTAHPFTHANAKIRFYRRKLAHYQSKPVHEAVTLDGVTRYAKGVIHHRSDVTIAARLAKINLYADLRAKEKHAAGRKPSLLKLVFVGPLIFLKTWVFRRQILNGRNGFVLSVLNGHYAFLKEARLFEYGEKKDKM